MLADLFEPASRPFLARFAGRRPGLAVDLGCGTGHTTRLLASALAPRRVLGLDQSASFVALAAADAPPGVEFAVHDVTRAPLPCPPADLLSCRLLLSHLPDPPAALATWATQLAPGGLLLVDEVDRIHTDDPALRGDLDTAGALLASRGQTLEIGPFLHRLPDPPGLTRRHDRLATLSPPAPRAAAMFAQNLAVWGPRRSPTGSRASGRWPSWSRTWSSWPPAAGRPASPGSCARWPGRPGRPAPRRGSRRRGRGTGRRWRWRGGRPAGPCRASTGRRSRRWTRVADRGPGPGQGDAAVADVDPGAGDQLGALALGPAAERAAEQVPVDPVDVLAHGGRIALSGTGGPRTPSRPRGGRAGRPAAGP